MMKTLWIRKDIWNEMKKVFELMKENDCDLTLNKALNKVLRFGLMKYADDGSSSNLKSLKSLQKTK